MFSITVIVSLADPRIQYHQMQSQSSGKVDIPVFLKRHLRDINIATTNDVDGCKIKKLLHERGAANMESYLSVVNFRIQNK